MTSESNDDQRPLDIQASTMTPNRFKFTGRPFQSVVQVDRYFPSEPIEMARNIIARTVEQAEGVSLIVGPPGTGKTLLCHVLAEQFREQLMPVILSSGRIASRKALLQGILHASGKRYRKMDEGELRLALIDLLAPQEEGPDGMLLLIDEAHALSPKLFEELRLLTNIVRQGSTRVRLVLAGGPILEDRFASPKLASFNQRLTARCYLDGFSSDETQQYVRAQLAAAGAEPESVMTDTALRTVHQATDGVPRLINQVCSHALMMAIESTTPFVEGRGVLNEQGLIDEQGIEQAWADLQQLPMPVRAAVGPTPALDDEAPSVSFDDLDDDLELDAIDLDDLDLVSELEEGELEEMEASAEAETIEELDPFEDLGEPIELEKLEEVSPETEAVRFDAAQENRFSEFQTGESQSEDSQESETTEEVFSGAFDLLQEGPLETLDRIQNHLDDIDEDFKPAGSIGPDLDVVDENLTGSFATDFSGQVCSEAQPSEENFIEEEIVLDNFLGTDASNVLRTTPSVHQPNEHDANLPLAAAMPPSNRDEVDVVLPEALQASDTPFSPSSDPVLPEPSATESVTSVRHQDPQEPASEVVSLPLKTDTPKRTPRFHNLFSTLQRQAEERGQASRHPLEAETTLSTEPHRLAN